MMQEGIAILGREEGIKATTVKGKSTEDREGLEVC